MAIDTYASWEGNELASGLKEEDALFHLRITLLPNNHPSHVEISEFID